MKKIQFIINSIILFYKNWRNVKPSTGDRVKVAVGFSTFKEEGIVDSVYNDYCWINQYDKFGNLKNCFTASFSYCVFNYLPKA